MDEVRGAVERFDARKHEPHRWALFHRRMAATLPWIRWAARLHHRRMARRYAAHAWAMDQAAAAACGIAA